MRDEIINKTRIREVRKCDFGIYQNNSDFNVRPTPTKVLQISENVSKNKHRTAQKSSRGFFFFVVSDGDESDTVSSSSDR